MTTSLIGDGSPVDGDLRAPLVSNCSVAAKDSRRLRRKENQWCPEVAIHLFLFLALGLNGSSLRAEGLKSAQVSRIFNEVKLVPDGQPPRPAAVADTVSGKAAVQTGAASRTELMFSDKTLTRLGANSYFSFVNGTRDMNLGSGTMLLQVPKGAGGAEIHTAAVTAAITGTTLMVEFNPKSYSKIIVLEGTVRVFLTKRIGESVLVHAGQMVIVPPDSASMPAPVSVDLKVLYATSGLINDFGPVASKGLIDREITRQRQDVDNGKLADTNLFIVGRGTQVQEGHLSFISAADHNITARQGAHSPLGLNETARVNPPPPTPPVVTPTPPIVTPTPPVVTPTPPLKPTPTPATPTPTPATPTPTPATPTPTPATPTPTPATPTPTPATPTPTPVPTATPPPTPTPTPSVSPTPTPTVTPSPTPSPSPSVSPTPTPPPPTPSKFGPLPVIANNVGSAANGGTNTAYAIDPTSAISTDPFITTQGVTDSGRIYRGGTVTSPATASSVDNLPSYYFLGATGGPSTFDTQVGFDTQFGTVGNVGGFKFSNLGLIGNPASISTVGGPTSLVFVATGNINDSAPGSNVYSSTFDLRGLDNVAFVTQNGAITFGNGLTFTNSGATATTLTLYARGGTLYNDNATFNLPGSALNLYSDTGIISYGSIGSTDAAGAGAVNFISGGALTVGGTVNASGGVTATTTADGAGDLSLIANSQIIAGGDFNATSGGAISALGTINTTGSTRLVAANGVSVMGNITAGVNLRLRADAGDISTTAASVFQLPGIFTADAATGSLTLDGTVGALDGSLVTPASANVTAAVSLTLTGNLIATDSVAVTGTGSGTVTQTDGTVEATGVNAQGTPSAGTVTITTDGGDISLNGGTVRGNTVAVTSTNGNITQGTEQEVFTTTGDATITSTNGTVTLGGTVGSAGGISASAGGDLLLQAAELSSGTGANVTLASTGGNVTLDEDTLVIMDGGTFRANANQTLTIAGTVGQDNEDEGGVRVTTGGLRAVRPSAEGISVPTYATGTAGNGINVSGQIITSGTGGASSGDENGIELTATGGNVTVSGSLEALGGGTQIQANNGTLTIGGFAYGNGDVNLTSTGDMNLNGAVQSGGGSVQATSDGALNVGSGGNVNADGGDVILFGGSSLTLAGNARATNTLNLSTYGALGVSGVGSGSSFSAQSYFGTLTVTNTGSLTASGGFGTVSTLMSPDKTNGVMAINGTVNVHAGEIDFTTGTTFANDPQNSSITAGTVNITAGTTATVQLSRFHYGGDETPSLMNVTAQTIFASTDADGNQGISPLNLTATGAITLTGNIGVQTLQGGNLTVAPNSVIDIDNLNTTGPTGAVVIGDGSTFTLHPGTNANAVGPITLDGSPTVNLEGSLAVAGGISATDAAQTPVLSLSEAATLTATGSIALDAGSINGQSETTVSTNGTVTTTGDVTVSTLNAHGGLSVGTLSAGTLTLKNLGGNTAANPPASVVNGAVSAYRFNTSMVNTFTLGTFTAGALQFAGISDLNQNRDAYSLTLNITGNFGVGAGGVNGYVTGGNFSGAAIPVNSTVYDGATGGAGGTFTVTTTPNTTTGAPGTISIQSNGTATVPTLSAGGGAFAPTISGITGTGGAGGKLALTAADALGVLNGAALTATGGNYTPPGTATYTGGGAVGGAGGTIGLTAGTTLTLTGGTGTTGTTTGPVFLDAQGGSVPRTTVGTGGAGGTVNLAGVTAVNLTSVQVNAAGGDLPAGTTVGNARGGTITVTSTGASSPTTTSVALTGATLYASSGASVSTSGATGVGGTISLLSQDASAAATPPPPPPDSFAVELPAASNPPSPTPAPAVFLSGTTVIASQEEVYPAATPTGSTTPAPTPTPAYASLTGGTINVTSQRTSGAGISVQDSSVLLALVDSRAGGTGGKINLTTSGADIGIIGGATVRASGANSAVTASTGATGAGTITVTGSNVTTLGANGTFAGGSTVSLSAGAINVASSAVGADLLKMQAFGTNGTIVINAGSTLTAATQLKLYATGSNGSITFQGGNITLNTGVLAGTLAANTITILTGTVVTVNGAAGQPLNVYANNNNYSASYVTGNTQTGTFAGNDAPVTAKPLGSAPTFSAVKSTGTRQVAAPAAGKITAAARNPAAPRLLYQGKTVLLVQPVVQTAATVAQNQAVLQSIAVSPNSAVQRNRAGTPRRAAVRDHATPVNPPGHPGVAAAALRQ